MHRLEVFRVARMTFFTKFRPMFTSNNGPIVHVDGRCVENGWERMSRRFSRFLRPVALVLSAWGAVSTSHATERWAPESTFESSTFTQSVIADRVTEGPDGKLYLTFFNGGALTGVRGQPQQGAIIRLNADGSHDSSFNIGTLLTDVWAIAFQADGSILAGGIASNETFQTGHEISRVFRFNQNGSWDSSYRSPVFAGIPRFMTLQDDGKLLVIPSGGASGNGGIVTMARLNANGSLDTTFAQPSVGDGVVFAPPVVDDAGGIFIAGIFSEVNGQARPGVARLLPDGQLDTAWVPSGFSLASPFHQIRGLAIQRNGANAGKLVIAGGNMRVSGSSDPNANRPLVRFNSDGSVDSSFTLVTQADAGMTVRPRLLERLADDSLVVVGSSVARFDANGALFSSGAYAKPSFDTEFFWMEALADGSVIVPPQLGASVNGNPAPNLVKFLPSGAVDTGFSAPDLVRHRYPSRFKALGDGKIITWGRFDQVNGDTARGGIARMNADGSLDGAYTVPSIQAPSYVADASVSADGGVLASVYNPVSFESSIVRLAADGSVDTGFVLDSEISGNLGSLAVTQLASGQAIVTATGVQQILDDAVSVRRLTSSGAIDSTFDASGLPPIGVVNRHGDGSLNTMVVGYFDVLAEDAGGRLIVRTSAGPYNAGAATVNATLVRLNSDGSIDSGFSAPEIPWGAVTSFPIVFDATFGGGVSTQVEATFAQSPFQGVQVQADGKILVYGLFTEINGQPASGLARLNSDGSLDTSFEVGAGANFTLAADRIAQVTDVKVSAAGRIWVGGYFTSFDGVSAPGVVQLAPDGSVVPGFDSGVELVPYTGGDITLELLDADHVVVGGTFRPDRTFGFPVPFHRIVRSQETGTTWLNDANFEGPDFVDYTIAGRATRDASGKIYATFVNGGYLTGADGVNTGAVIRLLPNGSVDNGFKIGTFLTQAWAVQPLADGRVLVGGVASIESGQTGYQNYRMFRFSADGTPDPSYRSPLFGGSPRFTTLQPDGKLLVVMTGNNAGNGGIRTIARLNPDGSLDQGFHQVTTDQVIFAPPALDADGKIYIGGSFSDVDGQYRPSVARLNADGTLDTDWVPTGFSQPFQVRGLAIQTQGANAGKLLIAGGTLTVASSSDPNANRPVIRLNLDGTIDSTFTLVTQADAGMQIRPRLMELLPDDRFMVVGSGVARFEANGALDTGYAQPALSTEAFWFSMAPDGSVIVPPEFGTTYNGNPIYSWLKFDSSGALDGSFSGPQFQTASFPDRFAVLPSGKILTWGRFANVGGVWVPGIVRMNTDGSVDSAFSAPSIASNSSVVFAEVADDGKILVAIVDPNGQRTIQRLLPDGAQDTSFTIDPTLGDLNGMEIGQLGDGRVLVWSTSPQRLIDDSTGIARLLTNGTIDSTFDPGETLPAFGAVYRNGDNSIRRLMVGNFRELTVDGNGGIIARSTVGSYPEFAGTLQHTILRLLPNGLRDTNFNAPEITWGTFVGYPTVTDANTNGGNPGQVEAYYSGTPFEGALAQADGKVIVYGSFTFMGGQYLPGIARLNTDGSLDTSFAIGSGAQFLAAPNRFGQVTDVSLAPNGQLWVSGFFDTFNGLSTAGLVLLNSEGGVVTSFSSNLDFEPYIGGTMSAKTAPDGSLIVSGTFSQGGQPVSAFHRLALAGATTPEDSAELYWRNPRPQGGTLEAVIHDGSRFVAVGTGSRVVFSTDGITWSDSVFLPEESMHAIAFDGANYVTVGGGGGIYRSTDLTNWTSVGRAPNYNWLWGVAHDTGRFVAVGDNGNAMVSTDSGATWAYHATGAGQTLQGVAGGNGSFVAVGNNGEIRTSADGMTWSSASLPSGYETTPLNGIKFLNNQFVAVGGGDAVFSSTDGTTWTAHALGTYSWLQGITYTGSEYFVVGNDNNVLRSTDLSTFTQLTTAAGGPVTGFRDAVSADGVTIVVGAGGVIRRSDNGGQAWTNTGSVGSTDGLFDVEWINNQFIAVGSSGTFMTSSDGVQWNVTDQFTGHWLNAVAYGAGHTVIAPSWGVMLVKADGQAWTEIDLGDGTESRDIIFANGGFTAVGPGGTTRKSTDGVNWTTGQIPGVTRNLQSIAFLGSVGVIVGDQGLILRSTDGTNWSDVSIPNGQNLRRVRAIDGLFVAVGDNRTVMLSTDGLTWNTSPVPNDYVNFGYGYADVRKGFDGYYVVSTQGRVLKTTDWVNWSQFAGIDVKPNLSAVAIGAGRMVVVGDGAAILSTGPSTPSGQLAFPSGGLATTTPFLNGGSATLGVFATGAGELTYAWKKDGSMIDGATSSVLNLSGLTAADAGTYEVTVTGGNGATLSSSTTLSVIGLGYGNGPFYGVGDLPSGAAYSEIRDATKANGVIYAVGNSSGKPGSNFADTGVLWRSDTGLVELPNLVSYSWGLAFVSASAITPDATYIASRGRVGEGNQRQATRVTTSNLAVETLPFPSGFGTYSAATAISEDGSVVYGFASNSPSTFGAIRFEPGTSSSFAIPMPDGPFDRSFAGGGRTTSSDGSILVGSVNKSDDTSILRAMRYEHGVGSSLFPLLAGGTWNDSLAVSPDGNTALLRGDSSAHVNGEIYLHQTDTGELIPLGSPNTAWDPLNLGGLSGDGQVAVISFYDPNSGSGAAYFRNSHGWFPLTAALGALSIETPGWKVETALGISRDGTIVFGQGVHNGNDEGFVVEFPVNFLADFNPLPTPPEDNRIVGTWIAYDGSTDTGMVTFRADGTYVHAQIASTEEIGEGGATGFERGTYSFGTNGDLGIVTRADTNGDIGLNDLSGRRDVTATIGGDTLTLVIPGDSNAVLTRVTTAPDSLVGGWLKTDPSGGYTLVTLLPNGRIYFVEEGEADADGRSGVEIGAYIWNSGTSEFSYVLEVDTNGGWGMSGLQDPVTATVDREAGRLTVTDSVETFVFDLIAPTNGGPVGTGPFYVVGDLPGGADYSQIRDATKVNGLIYAVGTSSGKSGSSGADTGVLWRSDSGLNPIPNLVAESTGFGFVAASAITPDGRYIASRGRSGAANERQATRVDTSDLSSVALPFASGFGIYSAATSISDDGAVLYGFAYDSQTSFRSMRYEASGPAVTEIPLPPGTFNDAFPAGGRGASADGSIMVGTASQDGVPSTQRAFRYVHGSGVSLFPMLTGGTYSSAMGVSSDGAKALLLGDSSAYPQGEIYLHDSNTQEVTPLGSPSSAWGPLNIGGMTADGSVVLVTFLDPASGAGATYFHNAHGWFPLSAAMRTLAIDPQGMKIDGGTGISSDGTLVFGSGELNSNRIGFVVEFPANFLADFNPVPAAPEDNRIVGTWVMYDGSNDTALISFMPDGTYVHAQVATTDEVADGGFSGFERGAYSLSTSGEFGVLTRYDGNGSIGLSDSNGRSDLTVTIDGDTLTLDIPNDGQFVATRLNPVTDSVVGGWFVDDGNGDKSLVALLPNGRVYYVEQGMADAEGRSGLEVGTYTWNAGTGAFTSALEVDTNGGWGLSGLTGSVTVAVDSTLQRISFTDAVETGHFNLVEVSPIIFTSQPTGGDFTEGGTLILSVSAQGQGNLTYQWRRNGEVLTSYPSSIVILTPLLASDAGVYDVIVTSSEGSRVSAPTTVTIPEIVATGRSISNLSARTTVSDGQALFLPFRIEGSGDKSVLLRAVGPTLSSFGVTGSMADPRIRLVDDLGFPVASNDDWSSDASAISTASSTVGAFALETESKDAALLTLTSRFVHTGILAGTGSGANQLVMGFVVPTPDQHPLLIRGVGPGTGLAGTIADPTFTVRNSSQAIVNNNDSWSSVRGAVGFAETAGAPPLVNASLDAANRFIAPQGAFTMTVTGKNSESGLVMAEVYDLSNRSPSTTPVLLVPPMSQSKATGDSVRFEAYAAGAGPLSYQWLKDGNPLSGETSATLLLTSIAAADAGDYVLQITNGQGTFAAEAATLAVEGGTVPTLNSQPGSATVASAGSATLSVGVDQADGPFSYQWYEGTSGDTGAPISGATQSTYTTPALSTTTSYWVAVTNAAGTTNSDTATVTVQAPGDISATHALVGNGYRPGETVTITTTLTYSGAASSFGWAVQLPDGWSYSSTGGTNIPQVQPVASQTGLIEWAFTSPAASPVSFTYTVNAPTDAEGSVQFTSNVLFRDGVNPEQTITVTPSPLTISPAPAQHSADTNGDFKLSLSELLRVIELYNTRFGTTRTGHYKVQEGSEDGFAANPDLSNSETTPNVRFHSADSNQDGKLNLSELLRVIELYNTRAGTVRTGAYHVQTGTEDGFAPGPDPEA